MTSSNSMGCFNCSKVEMWSWKWVMWTVKRQMYGLSIQSFMILHKQILTQFTLHTLMTTSSVCKMLSMNKRGGQLSRLQKMEKHPLRQTFQISVRGCKRSDVVTQIVKSEFLLGRCRHISIRIQFTDTSVDW